MSLVLEPSGERRTISRTWTDWVTLATPWVSLIDTISKIVEEWVIPLV
ncbi:hypothetical protein [Streptomyces coeruleorubidus]|uniref:Uncharacterized protein n=1 Tax=Streptomyces coeruleorubidus TaxID=116188 RepID=A0ABZ0KGL5_STRC4|nr:hypothetical protein [Streptomyces coeruleorubidus]WOT37008.1 hypothetical protein R5U08_24050 [Streptomyces coeruleorubidus]